MSKLSSVSARSTLQKISRETKVRVFLRRLLQSLFEPRRLQQPDLRLLRLQRISERENAAIAPLDDVLVDGGIKRHGVTPVVAGHARRVLWQAGRFHQPIDRQIVQRVRTEIFADLLQGMI